MFSSCVQGGKAYTVQKIRELKKLLFHNKKWLWKIRITLTRRNTVTLPMRQKKKQLRPKDLEKFTILKTFKSKTTCRKIDCADVEKSLHRNLREQLKVGQKMLELAKGSNKKDVLGNLYKSTTGNISFFNHEQVLLVI